MKRRKFLQLSALSSTSALFLNGHKVQALTQSSFLNQIPEHVIDGRSLVLIQLRGGNDGLNTLVPYNQYDDYAAMRPTIKLQEIGPNAAYQLDTTLSLDSQMLLHPSLTGFKTLYDAGKMNIIKAVGYPTLNKSHFAGRALMFKGGDGTPINANKTNGWIARFLHSGYDHTTYEDPLGIQLGSRKPSLGFHSEHEHKVDINLTGQDVSGYYNTISNIGNPIPPFVPETDHGENINFVNSTEIATNLYSERISTVFNAGSNQGVYSDTNLSDQLKTVARLIKGGAKTKIYLVTTDGYDTHADQVADSANSHTGTHADLLSELSNAMLEFQTDLELMGLDEKVITSTFTEFGRKPYENGSLGTDHGTLGPMFVIGKYVKPGIRGTNLDLSQVNIHFEETAMQHDYRQVFSTLIADFLGASSDVILQTEFEDFDEDQKIDLIQDAQVVDTALSISNAQILTKSVACFPNPILSDCTLRFESQFNFEITLQCYDLNGRLVFTLIKSVVSGLNFIELDLKSLKKGNYVLALKDNSLKLIASKHLIKM
jgi:uncharacterized protein (DUF1501 family)